MVVTALVFSILASLGAVAAAFYGFGQKQAADRSAAAAEAAERRAEAVERRSRFGWRIESLGPGFYALRNVGWADASEVRVTSDQQVELQASATSTDLAAGQAVAFLGLMLEGASRFDVTVTWVDPSDGAVREWVEPFPVRPVTVQEFESSVRRSLSRR